jgi:hypothetical protein
VLLTGKLAGVSGRNDDAALSQHLVASRRMIATMNRAKKGYAARKTVKPDAAAGPVSTWPAIQ